MRVHLINPPAARGVEMVREGRCMQRAGAWTAVWPPISLAGIAAVLENEGMTCQVDDCIIEGLSERELLARARTFQPNLFVLNTATPSSTSDLALADTLKRSLPNAFVAAIGIHVTALPELSLQQSPGLDVVVRGEPELTLGELARALRSYQPLSSIAGISGRQGEQIFSTPDRAPADLDALPFPAWHLIRRSLYRLPFSGRPFLLLATSRGCPYHCHFCADPTYYGHKLRTKSPGRIVDEIKYMRERFGIRDFLFWSESFTLDRSWATEVLQAIRAADLGVRFVVNSRSDHVDPEFLTLLKAAGGWMIGFGLESGSDAVLKLMNKNISREQNEKAVRWAKAAGLQITAHFVLGYPGETRETIRETIAFAESLPLDFAQFYCAVPFPGSPLYREARKKGWLPEDTPWERFEQNQAVLSTPQLSAAEVMAWRRRAYLRFYSQPARLGRILKEEVGLRGLPRFARMMWAFQEWL